MLAMSLYIPKDYRNLLGRAERDGKGHQSRERHVSGKPVRPDGAAARHGAHDGALSGTGINDDLNSIERPVAFPIKWMDEAPAEVVHSPGQVEAPETG